MPAAASTPLSPADEPPRKSAGDQSGERGGPKGNPDGACGERVARRPGEETGLIGGADILSEAEGSFSAATQETEKKALQRSGTKAKVGKGRRSDRARNEVDSAGGEERDEGRIHGVQCGRTQPCRAGRATAE